MKITVNGIGEIELRQRDFLASGGEGSIYAKGNTAYKIYNDFSKVIPQAKMQELSVLKRPNIIKPEQLIYASSKPVGYSMRKLDKTFALCQLFTKAFRDRHGITNDAVLSLVREFQDTIAYIHQHNIQVVDLNELNFLAADDLSTIYAIDVNSYQTPHFPATVIMDNIRDRHTKKYDEKSDWFSWGIVAFQMLIGIHPYKGTHPDYESVPIADRLETRMMNNTSVLNSKTSIPKVCRPFDILPKSLRQWFYDVFEKGERSAPPSAYDQVVFVVVPKEISGSDLFDIAEIGELYEPVMGFAVKENNVRIIYTAHSIYLNKKKYDRPSQQTKVVFTNNFQSTILAWIQNGRLKLLDCQTNQAIDLDCDCDNLLEINGNLIIQNGADLARVEFFKLNSMIATLKSIGSVVDIPGATRVFDNIIVQDVVGKFIATFFDQTSTYQIPIPEWSGHKLIDARFESGVLVAVLTKGGKYVRMVMRFNGDFTAYDLRKVENIVYSGINFTVADHGVCCLLAEDERLEVFSKKKDSAELKILDDPILDGDMKLFHSGTKIVFARNNKIYEMTMRKP